MRVPKNFHMSEAPGQPVATIRLKDAILEDLSLPQASVKQHAFPGELPPKVDRLRLELGSAPFSAELGAKLREALDPIVGEKGTVVLQTHAPFDEAGVAALRDALWPAFNAFRAYRLQSQRYIDRIDTDGTTKLTKHFVANFSGSAVALRRSAAAMAPSVIEKKFDQNAAGWSGDPKSPLWGHHRWMRRYVTDVAVPQPGEHVLDAGCGAGWVGIEAAKRGAVVKAFDPSPEMVKHVLENAAAEGVSVEAQVGFVEKPPWEETFALVLNSGVISFAPDADRFLEALDARVAPGGRLVIGDLNPLSRGMARRRRAKAILPIREMNALPRADVIGRLEARGYRITARRYYQLTYPVPELMSLSAAKLGGLGCGWLLARNVRAAQHDSEDAAGFDSWCVRAEKPAS